MAPCARLQFFSHSARTIGQKVQKADVPHAHHKRGWRSPTVQPAPPYHPASCWRVWPADRCGYVEHKLYGPPGVKPTFDYVSEDESEEES